MHYLVDQHLRLRIAREQRRRVEVVYIDQFYFAHRVVFLRDFWMHCPVVFAGFPAAGKAVALLVEENVRDRDIADVRLMGAVVTRIAAPTVLPCSPQRMEE